MGHRLESRGGATPRVESPRVVWYVAGPLGGAPSPSAYKRGRGEAERQSFSGSRSG